jgi:anti-anti-sigma factor
VTLVAEKLPGIHNLYELVGFSGQRGKPTGSMRRGMIMLKIFVQKLEKIVILQLQGRIVAGNKINVLSCEAVRHREISTLVLDLQRVERIDAAGLGALVNLREWALARGIKLKLMNVMTRVRHIFELTKLGDVLEFCSVEDMCFMLMQRPVNGGESLAHSESTCM